MKRYSVIILVLFISILINGCSGSSNNAAGTVNDSATPVTQRNTLEGEVIDASNTDELADVTVALEDTVVQSNSLGEYQFTGIASGTYVITAAKQGFEPYTGNVVVGANGQIITAFDITLYPPNYAGTVKGQVTGGEAGKGLAGVTVTIGEMTCSTDTEGNYLFEKVPPSLHDITAEKPGYQSASADFTITGGSSVTVNMVMNVEASPTQLKGIVKEDKAITVIGGAVVTWKDKTTISKDDGTYTLEGITPGTQKVTVSKAYYTSQSVNVQIKAGPATIQDFSLTQLQKDIRKKPYLVLTGDNTSMAVTWQTFNSHTADSTIQWGTTSECKDGSATVKENSAAKDEHIFYHEIKNLKPAAKTYYKVTVGKEVFTGEFRTPPDKNADSLVFYCYGDTRTQPSVHDAVLKDMMKNMDADTKNECHTVLINGGDFVSRGLMENYWDDEYFNPDTVNVQKFLAQIPILGVLGNHECAKQVGKAVDWDWKNAGKLYRKYWPYPSYPKSDRFYISYEYGPVHFSVLEVPLYFYHYQKYNAAELEEQKKLWKDECEWLDKDLASTAKEWKIVALHMPVYSSNTYNKTLDDDLSGLFKKHNVKIVLQSHVHNYSRVTVQGVQYTTCGGGGASLQKTGPYNSVSAQHPITAKEVYNYARFDISGKTLNVSIFGTDINSLDKFDVQDTFTINLP